MMGTTKIIRKAALTVHLIYRILFLLPAFFLINPFTDGAANQSGAILGFLKASAR
jgi:hypothetical protein